MAELTVTNIYSSLDASHEGKALRRIQHSPITSLGRQIAISLDFLFVQFNLFNGGRSDGIMRITPVKWC